MWYMYAPSESVPSSTEQHKIYIESIKQSVTVNGKLDKFEIAHSL